MKKNQYKLIMYFLLKNNKMYYLALFIIWPINNGLTGNAEHAYLHSDGASKHHFPLKGKIGPWRTG